MPPEMAKRLKKIAEEENRTQSELVREAFRRYEWDRDWAKIRAWGAETSKRFKIKSDEDVERIAG
jgi:predicted transcriptional regulator